MRKIYVLSTLVFLMLDAYAWMPSSRPGKNAQNDGDISLSIPDFDIHAGKSQEVYVDLQSAIDNLCQIQFDMTLPEGLSIALDEDGEFDVWGGPLIKKSNGYTHEVNAVKQAGGEMRVVVVSSSNTVFKSNNGTLLYITLKASADMEAGNYEIRLSDIIASQSDGTRVNVDESITSVNVLEKLPKSNQSLSLTELPEFTYGDNTYALPSTTDESLPLTWTVDDGTVASVSGYNLTFKGAGTATVTATQAGDDDYNEFSATFQLTVNKAQLTVKADGKTKTAGEANPELTVSCEGFVNGENESVLTEMPTASTTATTSSPAGTYPITVSGGASGNYEFNYVTGTLTVKDQLVNIIVFADSNVKALCVANWDTNHDGELSYDEAAAVTNLGQVFNNNSEITSFDELQYFTGLTNVGASAFDHCTGLLSVVLPETITKISNYAFWCCTQLTSINFPDGLTEIGYSAFSECHNLIFANLPNNLTKIDGWAFARCYELVEITIPDKVNTIGGYAFEDCRNLESIKMPDNVVNFTGYYAFGDGDGEAYSIKEVHISNLETWLQTVFPYGNNPLRSGAGLYLNGEEVKNVIIPDDITELKSCAFEGCSSLETVVLHKNITKIWGYVFNSCSNLNSVTSYIEEPFEFGNVAFTNISSSCVLYVPSGTRDAYIAAGWTENVFKGGIVEMGGAADVTLSVDACEVYRGEDTSVGISMDNTPDIIMVEFQMQLPEGVEIAMDEDGYYVAELNGDRSNGHQLEVVRSGEGIYHFLCYSSRNNKFNNNSGELINMRLVCDDDVEAGTYEGRLMNFVVSDDNLNEINPDETIFTIEVKDYLMGDVNGDTRINGLDIVEMVDKILDRPSTGTFIFAAGDFDGNGVINGMDLVEEVALVLSQTASGAKARKAPERLNPDVSSTMRMRKNNDGGISVGVESADSYILSQFVVELSEGQQLMDITSADRDHVVAYQPIDGNRYMVICYSARNATFTDNRDLLRISCDGEGIIKVTDAMLVDEDRKPHYISGSEFGEATGMELVNADGSFSKPADIYSVSGALVKRNASSVNGLGRGVYVVGGKTVIVK